jgi:hypothetical protein
MKYIQTIERLKSLRLHGMADALENILATKQSTHLNTEQILEILVQQEFDLRHSKRIARRNAFVRVKSLVAKPEEGKKSSAVV